LVQKRGGEVRWGILIKYLFGSQGEGRYFKFNLPFYPYTHQRVLWLFDTYQTIYYIHNNF
jgi:hypothetical protein